MSSDEATSVSERRRELVRRRLASAGLLQESVPRGGAISTGSERPLSPGQQRMWSIQQLDPRAVGYNVTLAVDLTGELDPELLGRALNVVVARHDILRTTYRLGGDGTVTQVVSDVLPPVYERHDLSDRPVAARAALVVERAGALAGRPFSGRRRRPTPSVATSPSSPPAARSTTATAGGGSGGCRTCRERPNCPVPP